METEEGNPGNRLSGRTTRRGFLGLAALAGAAVLGGCAGGADGDGQSPATISPHTEPSILPGLGAEPAAFTPPDPTVQPRPAANPLPINVDVCVVGGGAAGVAAATSAARMGAQVTLLEQAYSLGGNVTRGLVNLDKVAWGGPIMVAGYFEEIIRSLEAKGQAVYPSATTDFAVPCDVESFRHLVLLTARRAGVDVRLGTQAVYVERAGRRIEAVWAQEQGYVMRITAKSFIDCTGDGNLGYMAGATYWLGDQVHGQVQGQTLIFVVGPVDFEILAAFAQKEGGMANPYQVIGLRPFMKRLRDAHHLDGPAQGGLLINRNMSPDSVSISASETYGDHLAAGEMSKILTTLERQNYQIHEALVEQIPGFEQSRMLRMAERPYLREGRRIVGYHQLTADDILHARKMPDDISRGWYPIDLHASYLGGIIQSGGLNANDWYGIPYRCLVSKDLDNLLMAGRCISVSHEALGSCRISPLSMALGQAAGVASALAAGEKTDPPQLAPAKLRRELVRQGALI